MEIERLPRCSPGGPAIPLRPWEDGPRPQGVVAPAGPPEEGIRLLADAARRAQSVWAATPIATRLRALRRLRGLVAEHAPELAEASGRASVRNVAEALVAEVLPL